MFAPPPLEAPPGTYNIWNGFAIECYDPGSRVVDTDSPAVRTFLELFAVLCTRQDDMLEYLLDWIAQIFQQPGKKTLVAVLIKGEEGVGANDKFMQTATPATTLFGRFNRQREGRILIAINESSGSDNFAAGDVIKDMITCDEFQCEGKGTNTYSIACFARFIFTTNNANCLKITPDNRRFLVIEASSEKRGDTEFFRRLSAYIDDEHSRYEFYRFLMAREISRVDWENSRPISNYALEMIDLNLPYEHQFIVSFVRDEMLASPTTNVVHVRLDAMFDAFVAWARRENLGERATLGNTAKKFSYKMAHLVRSPVNDRGFAGVVKHRLAAGMEYIFDLRSVAAEMVTKRWAKAEDFEVTGTL